MITTLLPGALFLSMATMLCDPTTVNEIKGCHTFLDLRNNSLRTALTPMALPGCQVTVQEAFTPPRRFD